MTKEEQSKESLKQRDSLTEGRNGHAVHRDDPRVTQIGIGRRPADGILLCTGADRGIRGKKGKRTGVRFPFLLSGVERTEQIRKCRRDALRDAFKREKDAFEKLAEHIALPVGFLKRVAQFCVLRTLRR